MRLPHPVEVDVDGDSLVGLDLAEHALVEQQRVGAEIDVLPAGDDPVDELLELRVDRRLSAAQRHRPRSAVIQRFEADIHGEAVLELPGVPLHRASETGQITGPERLEHHHEGEALVALQGVLHLQSDHVGGDVQGKTHLRARSPDGT